MQIMTEGRFAPTRNRFAVIGMGIVAAWGLTAGVSAAPLPTTAADFVMPGTQPNTLPQEVQLSSACTNCHGPVENIYGQWKSSLMAHAGRDPLFYACLAIANQDAPGSGEMCIRCHMPRAWLAGRSTPPDGSAVLEEDRDSINCMFCHQMVDPINPNNDAPAEDAAILAALGAMLPTSLHSGSFVLDPEDYRRRGPFADAFAPHAIVTSPFHTRSDMCATCHDVSNPAYSKQPNGTYAANAFGQQAPSFDKATQFPVERTFTEWSQSAFAAGPIEMGGRFGGNKTAVSSCQDCHMGDADGKACSFFGFGVFRDNMPIHGFSGAATWVLDSIANLYPTDPNVDPIAMAEAKLRNIAMLQAAASMALYQSGSQLGVRIINETGHKLPTGYPEGRRMWLNVQFKNGANAVVAEQGQYNPATADLDAGSTKVYEVQLGVDSAVSALTGISAGPSFHFAANNVVSMDNRIPPRGFANANFNATQIGYVGYSYADGHYWDDTLFAIPVGAVKAEVTLYYQTSSKEYITFLRDTNVTNTAGQTLYDQWDLTGKSPPVPMASSTVFINLFGDFDHDQDVDQEDYGFLQYCVTGSGGSYPPECRPADNDGDGDIDDADVTAFKMNMTGALVN